MPALSKPTNGTNADYANRIGLLFDAFNNGNYNFPATQVPSADANTLDDYEEGTWTPTATFATAGNLSVAYTTRLGFYTKIGHRVFLDWSIVTSTFTHTTASGNFHLTGAPFTVAATHDICGSQSYGGITKANYSVFNPEPQTGQAYLIFLAAGSGQPVANLAVGDMPTGGTVVLRGQVSHLV